MDIRGPHLQNADGRNNSDEKEDIEKKAVKNIRHIVPLAEDLLVLDLLAVLVLNDINQLSHHLRLVALHRALQAVCVRCAFLAVRVTGVSAPY